MGTFEKYVPLFFTFWDPPSPPVTFCHKSWTPPVTYVSKFFSCMFYYILLCLNFFCYQTDFVRHKSSDPPPPVTLCQKSWTPPPPLKRDVLFERFLCRSFIFWKFLIFYIILLKVLWSKVIQRLNGSTLLNVVLTFLVLMIMKNVLWKKFELWPLLFVELWESSKHFQSIARTFQCFVAIYQGLMEWFQFSPKKVMAINFILTLSLQVWKKTISGKWSSVKGDKLKDLN